MISRGVSERVRAWVVTGPLGHLYGTLSDIVVAWGRWGAARVRARARRSG